MESNSAVISDMSETASAWHGMLADSLSGGRCEASCLETTSAYDLFLSFISNSNCVSPDIAEISMDAKLAALRERYDSSPLESSSPLSFIMTDGGPSG